MSIVKFKKLGESQFEIIPRETVNAICHEGALGLWVYLMCKPDTWVPRETEIRRHFGFGKDRYKSLKKYLKDLGLLTTTIKRNTAGRIIEHELEVRSTLPEQPLDTPETPINRRKTAKSLNKSGSPSGWTNPHQATPEAWSTPDLASNSVDIGGLASGRFTQRLVHPSAGQPDPLDNRDKVDNTEKSLENTEKEKKNICAEIEKRPISTPKSTPKKDLSPVVLSIPLIGDKEHHVTERDVADLAMTFPAVDVHQKLREIRQWNLDNRGRRKTARGIRTHISRWLGKEQDKGSRNIQGSAGTQHTRPRKALSYE